MALALAGFAFAAVDDVLGLAGRGVLSTPGFASTGVREGAVDRFVGVRDAIGLVVSRGTGAITAPGTGRCPTTGGGGVPGFGGGGGRGGTAPGVGGAIPIGVFADGGLAGGGGGTPIGREASRATGAGTALGFEGSRATGTGFDRALLG